MKPSLIVLSILLFTSTSLVAKAALAQEGPSETVQAPPSDTPPPVPPDMSQGMAPSVISEPPPEAMPPRVSQQSLTEQEREILDSHKRNAAQSTKARRIIPAARPIARGTTPASQAKAKTGTHDSTKLTVDYVDEPIQDVLRAVAAGYKLNLIPDKDIGDVKITIHLENIPVMEGLRQLCSSHGLDLIEEGAVLRVRRKREAIYSFLEMREGKLSLDVRHKPVRDFLREFGDKTRVNVVPAQALQGSVNGQLKQVEPLDGLKALMAANGFEVRLKNGVYLVEPADSSEGPTTRRPPRFGGSGGIPRGGGGDIDVQDGKVTLSLTNASLGDALREIAEEAGMNYTIIGEVQGSVTAHLRGVTIEQAMRTLLQGTRYAFMRSDQTLLIGDRNINTPSGVALSTAELIYLKYIRVENIDKIFPKTISAENIKLIKEQNAVLVSGTGEEIEQVRKFVTQVDLPTPQVLLEILVVEYNRSQTSELGIAPGKSDELGPNFNAYGSMSGVNQEWTNGTWKGVIGFLPPKFDLSLRALEGKNKAKVLAMPKVTTLNGNKAELKVAKTSYFKVSSVNKDGFQNNDYRSFDDGITIELTPWVTKHGEVNVQISPSIKTAGQPEGDSPAPITNRSITTNVTLMDGQTIALGGLIQSQEDNARRFVPILGSIPVLGYLFSYRSLLKINSELVIYVTPHILAPDRQGVVLEEELSSIEKRAGFVKTKDFIKGDSKAEAKPKDTSDLMPADSANGATQTNSP